MSKVLLLIIGTSFIAFLAIVGSIFLSADELPQSTPTQLDESSEVKTDEEKYTLQDVSLHSTKADCWTVIDQVVYDLTSFVNNHPGGEAILTVCGRDGTEDFKNQGVPKDEADSARLENNLPASTEFHSPDAREMLETLKIGVLESQP